ncbi:MAG TPA: glycosyltransferase family 39 protein [Vicinamibacterales bacterium]|nr:glycosyltransferase family 39 protein [Vicinamibacterales bacterium]
MAGGRFGPRLLLATILVMAAAVRLWGIRFGLPYAYARPDETAVAGAAVNFLSGDLRPTIFSWPTLFMYVVALLYIATFVIGRPFTGYETLAAFAESRRQSVAPFFYPARALSALMGVLSVWWVYAIGRRVFDETVGLVAAFFLALAFLHVRDSHFGVTDVTMTGLIVLAVLTILRWRETGGLGRVAIAGFAAGLAASTKYNGFGVFVPFGVALVQRFVDERDRPNRLAGACQSLAVFAAIVASVFFSTSPYIIIDWARFVSDVTALGDTFSVGHGIVLSRGWLWYARVTLPAAMGWPIFAAGVVGTVILLASRFRETAVLFAFPVAYYIVAGRGYTVFARYILPEVPFLCIGAAWLVVTAVRAVVGASWPSLRVAALGTAAIVMVAPTARKTIMSDELLTVPDNRVVVAQALMSLVPPDSLVYHSGGAYGHVPFALEGRELPLRECAFDEATGRFDAGQPDWIIVQRSPLVLYSDVPPALERVIADGYRLVHTFPVESGPPTRRLYDQQDAYFMPLEGFDGLKRPGPRFDLYQKR